jgi:hypothetical protein
MAFSMKLWQVQGPDLQEIKREPLDDEQRLENWVAKDPSILGVDLLLIGRQVATGHGGIVDLLAIDSEANLVVLELKRDKTPREIVAQALDYASSVNDFSYEQLETLTKDFTGKALSEAFNDRYGFPLPPTVNASHSIIILASVLDDSSERIVEYLSEQYGVPINVLFFTFFNSGSDEFLGRAWLKDAEAVEDQAQARKQAAGQGEKYARALRKLKSGDLVFGYFREHGYTGFGTVTRPAMMVRDFVPDGQVKTLLDLPLKAPKMSENKDDPALSEWVVGVNWQKTFSRQQAKTFPGIFANPNIVCRLRDVPTVNFLRKEFGIT